MAWRAFNLTLILAFSLASSACSIRETSLQALADSLGRTDRVYASEGDLELVRGAMPFALKTMESLIVELPDDRELLVGAAKGFTVYAYAFVELDANELEKKDLAQAREMRGRAKELYLRARDYGLRALELSHPGLRRGIMKGAAEVVKGLGREDLGALYWSAASWGAAISAAPRDLELVADLGTVELMMRRVLEIDEGYDEGAAHEFFLVYEAGRPDRSEASLKRAREHFRRAVELSGGEKLSPLVALAQSVSVRVQDREEFLTLLNRVLGFSLDQAPEQRFANSLAQRRARQLLARIDELFV